MFYLIQFIYKFQVSKARHFGSPQNWDLLHGRISATHDGPVSQLIFNATVGRRAGSAGAGVYIPIILATILAALAPMFGPFKWQAFIKVIALVLMYLSLGDFLQNNWEAQFHTETPSICEFYLYSIRFTLELNF